MKLANWLLQLKTWPKKWMKLVNINPLFYLKGQLEDAVTVCGNMEVEYVWGDLDPNDWWDMKVELEAKGCGEPNKL